MVSESLKEKIDAIKTKQKCCWSEINDDDDDVDDDDDAVVVKLSLIHI